MNRRLTALLLFALGGMGAGWLLTRPPVEVLPRPEGPRLSLVERDGRPWLLWEGTTPSGVVFQMENQSRVETIGVATHPARQQVVELAGWLGSGAVRVHARPDSGPTPVPLTLTPSEIEPYLDLLASRVLRRRSEEAWRRLGRFSGLYFSSGVGDLELKTELQALLVREAGEAGPGGARWLWGHTFGPSRETGLPGSPRVEAEVLGERQEDSPPRFRLPPVEGGVGELEIQVEVSPTPARDYWLEVELAGGWRARLAPGPEGGHAFQRLDLRALGEGPCEGRIHLRRGPDAPEELGFSLVGVALRILPQEEPLHANS